MSSKQVVFQELDISAQLRLIIATERLTVTELAAAAGVSKSAMEKYLAGPSSPRATSVASLCANLGLSIEWLLFGYSDNDRVRVRNQVLFAIDGLMRDLKQAGPLKDSFDKLDVGGKEFATFALTVASDIAEVVAEKVWDSRKRSMREAAEGYSEAALDGIPFRGKE